MKALSIKQPWAWLICAGYKDVENRTWYIHMPPLLNYPATPRRIYVHAGKEFDYDSWCDMISGLVPGAGQCQLTLKERFQAGNGDHLLGAIIGEVDITGCVDESDSPWFVGPYGFTLDNAVLYAKPIPCKGRLGFFQPDIEVTL